MIQRRIILDDVLERLTFRVPELGGLMFPFVIASQIESLGKLSSDQRAVKSGESHRTIDDGSSYRINKFSSLRA